jgi:hypothetical protein
VDFFLPGTCRIEWPNGMAAKGVHRVSNNKFRIFPPERMEVDFPWIIWAVGWLALLKAFIWLAHEPVEPANILNLMAYKNLLNIVPLVIFGVGVWNLKKWAIWGILVVALGNLIFFFVNPQTFNAVLVHSEVRLYSILLSSVTLLCNGPVGDLLILFAAPSMLKNARRRPA